MGVKLYYLLTVSNESEVSCKNHRLFYDTLRTQFFFIQSVQKLSYLIWFIFTIFFSWQLSVKGVYMGKNRHARHCPSYPANFRHAVSYRAMDIFTISSLSFDTRIFGEKNKNDMRHFNINMIRYQTPQITHEMTHNRAHNRSDSSKHQLN